MQPERPLCIAHRGASALAPENTLSSFDLAVNLKADYIEMDIQLTKDNQLVVIHDNTVDRTTNGKGMVKNFRLNELKKLNAGSCFNKSHKFESIPTLNEVLFRYDGSVNFLIEMKDPHLYPGIEYLLAKEIKKKKNKSSIIVQSFDSRSLRRFKKVLPEIPIGLLTSFPPPPNTLAQLAYLDYVNVHYSRINGEVMNSIKENNKKTFVWTVNSKEAYEKMRHFAVDGIITDDPRSLYTSNDINIDEYLEKIGDFIEFFLFTLSK